jgi:hypothetical protein
VQQYEAEELERLKPVIAEAASKHRVLEARLAAAEKQAAKEENPLTREKLQNEAVALAKELAAHQIPAKPQMYCDDATPEKLGKLLAAQGGRILQAGAEGTAFEIAKGRYSKSANFDVYLKGYSGDPLRIGRIVREDDIVDQPALSVALAVQPDVIQGLADQVTMRGRGFLARFLYSIPRSLVGNREIGGSPVPEMVAHLFTTGVLAMWRLKGTTDEKGKPAPHHLVFSEQADQAMRDFEKWLEPQLRDGKELSYLAGWANKLAGAIARIAGILHVATAVGKDGPCTPWLDQISVATAAAAIRLGRDYLLPHALAAFGLMGADPRIADARKVVRWIISNDPERFTRSEVQQGLRGTFKTIDHVDPVLSILVKHSYIRPEPAQKPKAAGRPASPGYEVNPTLHRPSDNTDNTDKCSGPPNSQYCQYSQSASEGEKHGDAWEGETPVHDDSKGDGEVPF